MKIFVYGTLLKGLCRSRVLENSRFFGHGFVEASLYDLGSYPGIKTGSNAVYGELYEVDKKKLSQLDEIEGYCDNNTESSLFIRLQTTITMLNDGSTENAYSYFFNQSTKNALQIHCGDYRRYLLEKDAAQWYIAYGSNLSTARLKKRIGTYGEIKKGYLDGYRLIFNKKADGNGTYANICYAGNGDRCHFVAYQITKEQLSKLDVCEGEPSHYVRIGFAFCDIEEYRSYVGHIYIANTNKLIQDEAPPADYLKYIYDGYQEHGFDTSFLLKFKQ